MKKQFDWGGKKSKLARQIREANAPMIRKAKERKAEREANIGNIIKDIINKSIDEEETKD